jgi:hypothetical protein
MLAPSWRDDITVVVSPPLGAVFAALDEELVRPIAVEAGSEYNTVWSAQHGVRCAQGARFLRCTRL